MNQRITYTNCVSDLLAGKFHSDDTRNLIVVTDENVAQMVLPRVAGHWLNPENVITIPAGDDNKNLETLTRVWRGLEQRKATRGTLVINLGGGMVTDLGGMAAATFKRGIPFINVPTTLLGAVDAAVGGKTGINFNGLKNELGVFASASEVIVSACFFDTLPHEHLLSGYAEMLKHALLDGREGFVRLLGDEPSAEHPDRFLELLRQSIDVKQRFVEQDPCEQGLRRTLNLGHTVGHALEELALRREQPVPHGYAVAWGLVAELVLSHTRYRFPSDDLHRLATFVRNHYPVMPITCDDYPALLGLMHRDKKSRHGEINCTLLHRCGVPAIDNAVTDDEMQVSLDIFRDLMGI